MLGIELELELELQYERCFEALNKAGILEMLPKKGILGVVGIDGQEYPIPEYERVLEVVVEKELVLKEKMAQGFTKLQLTPIVLPLELFQHRISEQIRRHFTDKKLFYTGTNQLITEIIQYEPLWSWVGWLGGELSGKISYYPQRYDKSHGGLTKRELLEKIKNTTPFLGWIPLLIEDLIFLPREDQGETIGGRKQLENNKRPIDYLEILQQEPYRYESGWTMEDWLTSFAQRLEITDQVSNDWNDSNAMWLLGNYHDGSGVVPRGHWGRDIRKGHIDRDDPNRRREVWGAASAIKIAEI